MQSLRSISAQEINKQLSNDAINILFEEKIKNTYFPMLLHIEYLFSSNELDTISNDLYNILKLFIDEFPQFVKISNSEIDNEWYDIVYEADHLNHVFKFENDSITNLFPQKSIVSISTLSLNDFNTNNRLIQFFINHGSSERELNQACVIKKLD